MLTKDFGGSGEGIYAIEMNVNTGELNVLRTYFLRNPAYLVRNSKRLYAVSELENFEEAKVTAFNIQEDYGLKYINQQGIEGSLPCHINFLNSHLFISCYGSGNLLNYPVGDNGEILAFKSNFKHTGSSVTIERQESPHAHQIVIHPNRKYLFVPDLGIDKIKGYTFENDILKPENSMDISITSGNGPRHMVFNSEGDIGYVMNELTGKVSIIKQHNGKFEVLSAVPALPGTYKDVPSGSAIRLHPNGKYLYAANRTIDIITIFHVEGNHLNLLNYQYTQGKTIREFNISPNGEWLIACLQDSNEVISYNIQPNGLLEERSRTDAVASPVCVCF